MAYKVIILYRLYMPSYFLGTFTEYPFLILFFTKNIYSIEQTLLHRMLYEISIQSYL